MTDNNSYTCVTENAIERLKNIGAGPTLFSVHSLQHGGAKAAANLGIKETF